MSDELHDLQTLFLTTGKGLDRMYTPLLTLANKVLYDTLSSRGLYLTSERIEELTHDATTCFIETHYLTKHTTIQHFYPMMRWNIYQQLGWAKRGKYSKQRQWDQTLSLDQPYQDTLLSDILYTEEQPDLEEPLTYIRELADKNIWIPYYLYHERSFEKAILKILPLGGQTWTRSNWNKLHKIFTVLKRKSSQQESLKHYCKHLKKSVKNTVLEKVLS